MQPTRRQVPPSSAPARCRPPARRAGRRGSPRCIRPARRRAPRRRIPSPSDRSVGQNGPADEARRNPPRHLHHRRCARRTSSSTPARSACGWSRRPSTRTTRPSTTSSTPTSAAAPAPTSPSSSTRARRAGRAGDGMVHRVVFRVASEEALDFWAERAGGERSFGSTLIHDPEGPRARARRRRLRRRAADRRRIRRSRASSRCAASPACAPTRPTTAAARCSSGASASRPAGSAAASSAAASTSTTMRPRQRGLSGAGTVHHVAWASTIDEHEAWREKVISIGGQPHPVIDRFYFRSIYFREPSGVLFEIATLGPGFTSDEPLETLGERLSLPPELRASARPARAAPDAAPEPPRDVIFAERPPRGRRRGRARAGPRPRRGRARPARPPRRPRPRAALPRLLPARPALAPAGRRPLVRRAARRLSRTRPRSPRASRLSRASSTRCRTSGSCSAASRRAR